MPKSSLMVGSKNKAIRSSRPKKAAQEHAHVDNRQVAIDFAADWIEDNL
jgi:hypothetical protein